MTAEPPERTVRRERAGIVESAEQAERAVTSESTAERERAEERESTAPHERRERIRRDLFLYGNAFLVAVKGQPNHGRAPRSLSEPLSHERTEEPERAAYGESTVGVERAAATESPIGQERAGAGESTATSGARAVTTESTEAWKR